MLMSALYSLYAWLLILLLLLFFLMPSGVQVPKAKNKKLKTNIVVASGPTTINDGLP